MNKLGNADEQEIVLFIYLFSQFSQYLKLVISVLNDSLMSKANFTKQILDSSRFTE